MNKYFIIFMIIGLLFYGCEKVEIQEGNFSVGKIVVSEEEKFNDGLDKALEELESIDKESYRNLKEFKIKAKQWEFEPVLIDVNKGDYVVLYVISSDITHGFVIPEYNVDVILDPGKTEIIEFVADKKGIFGFSCSDDCDGGHFEMNGKLIVSE